MASMEHQASSSSYDAVDMFGEQEILPRVGNQYQAKLPQLLGDSNSLSLSMDDEIRADSLQNFHIGSPIKLARISSEQRGTRGSQTSVEEIGERSGEDYRLVPEICYEECWTAAEKGCFLLGLYIFAKNFVEVKKFVGTKGMGALQLYYYGTFHSSPEHHKWSSTRKMKHKKGRGFLFSGLRLQEFVSRLHPRVGECQNTLLEVSKSFESEKISVAEFVFSLKAMIGADLLVEAVGIGRGDQDLTAMATKHSKSNLVAKNAYSSLTTAEISNLLSGEHRLSKARSSDLFWEAVWPRLLANGWHSEQATTLSPNLVFLMPGVGRFSRRKMVRGDQYFESVSDVLSKVAQEPALLELDLEDVGCSIDVEQSGWTNEGENQESDENHSGFSLMKFTVVDTSLSNGKVVEFRTFPSAAEISQETPNGATILGKKRAHVAMDTLVHKKRNTQDEDEVNNNLEMLPSTSSSSSIEQPRAQLLIDLNVPLDNEDAPVAAAERGHEQDMIITSTEVELGEQSSLNQTRYSTRRRPPTMRVLEAFARGYLSVNKRQKRKEDED